MERKVGREMGREVGREMGRKVGREVGREMGREVGGEVERNIRCSNGSESDVLYCNRRGNWEQTYIGVKEERRKKV